MPPNHRPAPRPANHPARPAARPVHTAIPVKTHLVRERPVDIAGMNYLQGFAAGVATMWQKMSDAGLTSDADHAVVATLTREETTMTMLRDARVPVWDLQKIERAIARVPGAATTLAPGLSVASR